MISTGSAPLGSVSFRILSRSQLDDIHDASMRILRQTGVRVDSDEAVTLLDDAGAFVGAGGLVRIPEHLIERAVRTAPGNVTVCDRDGAEAMQVGRRRTYFGSGSDTPNVIDPYTGERRRPVLADVAGFARVADALPNIDFLMCMGIASDVPAATAELHHFAAMVRNSSKPVVYTALDLAAAVRLLDMAGAVAGGEETFRQRPFAIMYIEPVSPLGFAADDMDKLLFCAAHGIPCIFMSGMLSGGTGPITPAGALALANAESLAGILIAQLKGEGTPVISGGGILSLDMRTSVSSYGSPEFMLTTGAMAELAQYYGLPAWGYAGCSDAKCFDEQAAADATAGVMAAALSGTNLAHDVGFLEGGLTSSFEQLVFTDEVIGKTVCLLGGITVDDETLAVDVTDQVGPGGAFLRHKHTSRHCREVWAPELEDRQNHGGWVRDGSLTMAERVNARVRRLLETHAPAPLPAAVDARLTELLAQG